MSNNKNNNKNKEDNPNAYREFMPYWKKEEDCFDNIQVVAETANLKGKTTKQTMSWPRIKPTEQRIYENFMAKITSSVTGEFYFERDKAGNQVEQKDGKNARYIIHTIIRVKRPDNSEWLYTQGRIEGFDSLGSPIGSSISAPEKWTKTEFAYQRRYDQKSDTVVQECNGIKATNEVYELPYSQENIDKLYQQSVSALKRNGTGIKLDPNANPGEVQLIVKDEGRDFNISIKWSSIEESLKLFKEKEFEYLFNGDYMPAPVKAEARAKSEGLTNNNPVEIPRLEKDNKNYKGYTL